MSSIGGPAAAALGTLTPEQISFLQSVPKAELHAHLNGSIPIPTLQELAAEHLSALSTLESHHILQYLKAGHPISICTDDILPFRTSLLAEYALLLAQPPYGLGLSEEQIVSLQARFKTDTDKEVV